MDGTQFSREIGTPSVGTFHLWHLLHLEFGHKTQGQDQVLNR